MKTQKDLIIEKINKLAEFLTPEQKQHSIANEIVKDLIQSVRDMGPVCESDIEARIYQERVTAYQDGFNAATGKPAFVPAVLAAPRCKRCQGRIVTPEICGDCYASENVG